MDLFRRCRWFCRTTLNIVLVCLPFVEQLSIHHRSEFSTIGIREYGLSGV